MSPSSSYLSNTTIFHFHEYESGKKMERVHLEWGTVCVHIVDEASGRNLEFLTPWARMYVMWIVFPRNQDVRFVNLQRPLGVILRAGLFTEIFLTCNP